MSSSSRDPDDGRMVGVYREDWLPLIAAIVVAVIGNVITYLNGWTVQAAILFAPFAAVAFGAVRYLLHGSPFPDALQK